MTMAAATTTATNTPPPQLLLPPQSPHLLATLTHPCGTAAGRHRPVFWETDGAAHAHASVQAECSEVARALFAWGQPGASLQTRCVAVQPPPLSTVQALLETLRAVSGEGTVVLIEHTDRQDADGA